VSLKCNDEQITVMGIAIVVCCTC